MNSILISLKNMYTIEIFGGKGKQMKQFYNDLKATESIFVVLNNNNSSKNNNNNNNKQTPLTKY